MSKNLLLSIIKNELLDIVGYEDITVREAERLAYSMDFYLVPQMWIDRHQTLQKPDFIVFPESAAEVSRIHKLAVRHGIPVIPYGGGTGSQGGVVPLYGGIIIDLKKMDQIIKIDETSLTVTAQPGINGQHLEWAINKKGFTLAHYPSSEYGATLGGYVAARGSGTLSTKYGKAEDMVVTMEVVLASGEIIRSLPVPNHACGPGFLQLFVGSEGTLGTITEITMRLDPIPEVRKFNSYIFEDVRQGLEAGRRIMTQRLHPCVIRLYDSSSSERVVKRVLDLDMKGAFMVVGSDGDRRFVELEMQIIQEICTGLEGKELGPEPGEHWWKHRYDFYFPPHSLMLPEMFGTVETISTYDKIYNIFKAKQRVITEDFKEWGTDYMAHFSHWFPWGVMVYDRFLIAKPPIDPQEALQLHTEIWGKAARASLKHGGVLNDHHGIGFKLGWLMEEQYGTAWPMMQGIKDALDPAGIMNPGKLGFIRRK